MNVHTLRLVFSAAVAATSTCAFSQHVPPPLVHPGPRVAIALQGGSAYGLIHLGALEWLEEHRIPLDGIAGTSGGALSGGWYATGLEFLTDAQITNPIPHNGPQDMQLNGVRQVLDKTDVDDLFRISPPYKDTTLARKQERIAMPSELFYGIVNGGVRHPDGLLPAPKVGMLIEGFAIAYPASYLYQGAKPFDNLPTPFRCVVTDATDSDPFHWEPAILGGDNMLPRSPGHWMTLSRAIRASIGIPGVFTPVYVPQLKYPGEQATYALIDGGLFANYPFAIGNNEFQPDIMLGLHFGDESQNTVNAFRAMTARGPLPRSLVEQWARRVPVSTWNRSVPVEIELSRGNLTPDQFSRWRDLAWLGYQSMEDAYRAGRLTELMRAQLPLADYLAFRALKRRRRSGVDTVVRDVVATSPLQKEPVHAAVVGRDLSDIDVRLDLQKALLAQLADGNLASVVYNIDQRPAGSTLVLSPEFRSYGPPFVHFGLDTDAGSRDRNWAEFSVHAVLPDKFGSSWWLDARFGNDMGAAAGVEMPGNNRFFFGPVASYWDVNAFSFLGETRKSSVRLRTTKGGVVAGYRPSRNLSFAVAGYAANLDTGQGRGVPMAVPEGDYREIAAGSDFDSTNDPVIPTKGLRAHAGFKRLFSYPGAGGDLSQAEGRLSVYWPLGNNGSALFLRGDGGTSFGRSAPFSAKFSLGSFGQMDAFVRDEVRDSGFGYGSVGTYYKLSDIPNFVGSTYVGAWVEAARANSKVWSSGTIGLIANTRIGPAFAGVAVGDHRHWRLLFQIGHSLRD